MSHTPGPWKQHDHYKNEIWTANKDVPCMVAMTRDINVEDARLIASAPDLLAALETARAIINKDIDWTEVDADQIASAIAKAKGEGS